MAPIIVPLGIPASLNYFPAILEPA
jgi:hypothetical protein